MGWGGRLELICLVLFEMDLWVVISGGGCLVFVWMGVYFVGFCLWIALRCGIRVGGFCVVWFVCLFLVICCGVTLGKLVCVVVVLFCGFGFGICFVVLLFFVLDVDGLRFWYCVLVVMRLVFGCKLGFVWVVFCCVFVLVDCGWVGMGVCW